MTAYDILKPINSKVLGAHDSGIINVNPFSTGNELSDNFMNDALNTEVEALLEDGSIETV